MTSTAIIHQPQARVPHPWEQYSSEPEEAFLCFRQYRDMRPPRRYLSVKGKNTHTIQKWYQDFHWAYRTLEYDRYQEAIILEERETILRQGARELTAEHMYILKSAREIVQDQLDKLLNACKSSDEGILMRPKEINTLLDSVIKLDRLIRGESTENTEHKVDLSALSVEELRQYRQLAQKIDSAPKLTVVK